MPWPRPSRSATPRRATGQTIGQQPRVAAPAAVSRDDARFRFRLSVAASAQASGLPMARSARWSDGCVRKAGQAEQATQATQAAGQLEIISLRTEGLISRSSVHIGAASAQACCLSSPQCTRGDTVTGSPGQSQWTSPPAGHGRNKPIYTRHRGFASRGIESNRDRGVEPR